MPIHIQTTSTFPLHPLIDLQNNILFRVQLSTRGFHFGISNPMSKVVVVGEMAQKATDDKNEKKALTR